MTEDLSSTVHRLYLLAYLITLCLAIMISVSSGVVTDYWHQSIDGCILYADIQQDKPGTNSSWSMSGSDISVCNYATFTPVFFIFICCLCASFHLRHLFCKRCWRAEESEPKNDFWEMMIRLLIVLSSFMTLLALVVACILTHGHDWTCSGLRTYVTAQGLSPWLGISAGQIHELFARLDCGFFYSALDYGLKIGADGNSLWSASSIIDSNTALEVAMATAWFEFFMWLGLTLANFWLAHRMQVELLSIAIPALPSFFNKE